MEFSKLLTKLKQRLEKQLPFVLYSLPDTSEVIAMIPTDGELHSCANLDVDGFLMRSFNEDKQICFATNQCEIIKSSYEKVITFNESFTPKESKKERLAYMELVASALEDIHLGGASKIVLSRQPNFRLKRFDIKLLLERLFGGYRSAFRYFAYDVHSGVWCGASPEQLLKTNGNEFHTMSLAGTRVVTNNAAPSWTPKEFDEQRIVTDAIGERLQKITSILKVSKTYSHSAGSLMHLRNDFNGVFRKGKASILEIANVLHPTPAVCGMPTKEARDFILSNETKPRQFYTGYLGLISEAGKSSNLFVNLRCMNINDERATLFVGGGIVAASRPLDEWTETQNKLATMGQVIAPML